MMAIGFPRPACGELRPDEIVILANASSNESLVVAAHYKNQRGIADENICSLAMPIGETLDRTVWDEQIRPAIRSWIAEQKLATKVRCIVTTYDVPLRIAGGELDREGKLRKVLLSRERTARVERLKRLTNAAIDALGGEDGDLQPVTFTDTNSFQAIQEALATALGAIQKKIFAITEPERRQKANDLLRRIAIASGGTESITQSLINGIRDTQA